jgi:hypothetical protein
VIVVEAIEARVTEDVGGVQVTLPWQFCERSIFCEVLPVFWTVNCWVYGLWAERVSVAPPFGVTETENTGSVTPIVAPKSAPGPVTLMLILPDPAVVPTAKVTVTLLEIPGLSDTDDGETVHEVTNAGLTQATAKLSGPGPLSFLIVKTCVALLLGSICLLAPHGVMDANSLEQGRK